MPGFPNSPELELGAEVLKLLLAGGETESTLLSSEELDDLLESAAAVLT